MLTDKFEITVCNEFIWVESNFAYELLHSTLEGQFFEIFESEDLFLSAFAINKEEGILDTTDCSSISIYNVIVPDKTVFGGSGDGGRIVFGFGEGSCFTS